MHFRKSSWYLGSVMCDVSTSPMTVIMFRLPSFLRFLSSVSPVICDSWHPPRGLSGLVIQTAFFSLPIAVSSGISPVVWLISALMLFGSLASSCSLLRTSL